MTANGAVADPLHATNPRHDHDHPAVSGHQRRPQAAHGARRPSALSTYQTSAADAAQAILGRLVTILARAGRQALDLGLTIAAALTLTTAAWLAHPIAGWATAGAACLALRLHWTPAPPAPEPELTPDLVDAIVSLHRSGLDTPHILAAAAGNHPPEIRR